MCCTTQADLESTGRSQGNTIMFNVRNTISVKLSAHRRAVFLITVPMLKQSSSAACHRKHSGLKSGSEGPGF